MNTRQALEVKTPSKTVRSMYETLKKSLKLPSSGIPQFPQFKHLELEDKQEIVRYTSKYVPYSDFNFTSLWSWDTDNECRVSLLNDNLVIQFADYVTGEPFFSLIGNVNINETVDQIMVFAKAKGIIPVLKLVPEEVATKLDTNRFIVEEDRDNFDYIFSIESLATMAGAKLASKRNHIKRYKKDHDSSIGILSRKDLSGAFEDLINICKEWAINKKVSEEDLGHELYAIERYFSMSHLKNHTVWGVRVAGELIAFWVVEIINEKFAISHFQKSKLGVFNGVYPYLNQVVAQDLFKQGILFINFEQDLGIPGLREGKSGYNPCGYLKKFIVKRSVKTTF